MRLAPSEDHGHGAEPDRGLPDHISGDTGDQFPTAPSPLHVNVHLGATGIRQGGHVVWVQGGEGDLANCSGYVND